MVGGPVLAQQRTAKKAILDYQIKRSNVTTYISHKSGHYRKHILAVNILYTITLSTMT